MYLKYKAPPHNNQDLYNQTATAVAVADNLFSRNLEAGYQVAPAVLRLLDPPSEPPWREVKAAEGSVAEDPAPHRYTNKPQSQWLLYDL